jgi:hypothetical protein
MDPLEKFILENHDSFDTAEPAAGHFGRFQQKIGMEERSYGFFTRRSVMMRIAASLMILLAFSFFLTYVAKDHRLSLPGHEKAYSGLPVEVREAISYYDNRAESRIAEIRNMEKACPGASHLTAKAEDQVKALDEDVPNLEKTLRENPDNEKVKAALIQNRQMKEQILDNMIQKGCPNN